MLSSKHSLKYSKHSLKYSKHSLKYINHTSCIFLKFYRNNAIFEVFILKVHELLSLRSLIIEKLERPHKITQTKSIELKSST